MWNILTVQDIMNTVHGRAAHINYLTHRSKAILDIVETLTAWVVPTVLLVPKERYRGKSHVVTAAGPQSLHMIM